MPGRLAEVHQREKEQVPSPELLHDRPARSASERAGEGRHRGGALGDGLPPPVGREKRLYTG